MKRYKTMLIWHRYERIDNMDKSKDYDTLDRIFQTYIRVQENRMNDLAKRIEVLEDGKMEYKQHQTTDEDTY